VKIVENTTIKQILGIVGSPRRGGNTEILVDEVLTGAKEAGAFTEKIILNELNITPCQACNGCQKTGRCVQQDDMLKVLKKMESSPVWVLGTPIYWWGPSAQFKAFLDRWYSARQVLFKGKRVILTISMGGGHSSYARHTIGMFKDIIPYLGMELIATVLAPGGSRKGAVRDHTDILAMARRAGREPFEMAT
jgi:multimeric flavodoxin WrbA